MPLTTTMEIVFTLWALLKGSWGSPGILKPHFWEPVEDRKETKGKGSGNNFRQESGNTALREWTSCWGLKNKKDPKQL